jgi:hypothetical protein
METSGEHLDSPKDSTSKDVACSVAKELNTAAATH